MNHLTEDQLVLHYYGEEGDTLTVEQHLDACEACRGVYASLQRVLNIVDSMPVPERGPDYEAQVWQRIGARIPARRRLWSVPAPWRWAAAALAFASLMVGAFLAGRFYPQQGVRKAGSQMAAADPHSGERVLLVAVGDYLERSQMVLIELANANPRGGPLDISAEQERAADLVSESRLYRQTAARTGDSAVTSILDDLDRVLLEITHAPSQMTAIDLDRLRERLKAEGILFKIRVLGSNVRNQEEARPDAPAGTRRTL